MNRLKQLWSNLRSSLWFVPVLIVVCSVGLAVGFIEVDGRINRELLADYPRIFDAGADGSRGMLSAIAGSMITVAGLTFSLTLLAMAQASSQYTSRILRNFMGDRRNQFVLGFFVGIFAYCLIVFASERNCIVRMERGLGAFVVKHTVVLFHDATGSRSGDIERDKYQDVQNDADLSNDAGAARGQQTGVGAKKKAG